MARVTYPPLARCEEHLLHVGAAVARDEIVRRALVDDGAGAKHDHVVAHALDLAHVVRGEEHGAATRALVVLEIGAHAVADVRVERRGGLVQQQHLGLVEQRLRDRYARALPRRQLAVRAVQKIDEVELPRKLADAPVRVARRRRGRANTSRFSRTVRRFGRSTYGDVKFMRGSTS